MKRSANQKAKRFFPIGIPALLTVLFAACFLYLKDYYHADVIAVSAFHEEAEGEERVLTKGDISYISDGTNNCLILYPGAKVEHTAYIPLMRLISSEGVACVICNMPFHLALFRTHAADSVREAFPEIKHWYIAGHSLGGVVASMEMKKHPGVYDGLILLGAYANEDLSDASTRVLLIRGSEDGVLNTDKYEAAKANLPADSTEIVLDGGCHAYFGMYGPQKGDGTPRITNEEQIRITAEIIAGWIGTGGTDAENP